MRTICAAILAAAMRRRRSRPRGRAVDRAAMRANRNYVGQLAFRRKVSRDVLVVGGYGAKFFTGAFVWIENEDGFPRSLLEIVKRCNEIGVARDKHDAVKVVFHVVNEHLGCDINIRTLFFCFPHGCDGNLTARPTWFFRKRKASPETFIVTFNDLEFRTICFKGGKIYRLPHLRGWFGGVIVDAGGEIFYGQYFVIVWTRQKRVCESYNIQPFVMRKAEQPIIQVESVNVNNCPFLLHSAFNRNFTRQEPDFRPALHRIAEAQRSVNNPSWGSASIISNLFALRKWENFAICRAHRRTLDALRRMGLRRRRMPRRLCVLEIAGIEEESKGQAYRHNSIDAAGVFFCDLCVLCGLSIRVG